MLGAGLQSPIRGLLGLFDFDNGIAARRPGFPAEKRECVLLQVRWREILRLAMHVDNRYAFKRTRWQIISKDIDGLVIRSGWVTLL